MEDILEANFSGEGPRYQQVAYIKLSLSVCCDVLGKRPI